MTIGERIRARRIELNMSQEELARRLDYKSRASINKIELNGRNLTQSKIKKIADALETTPSYIMGWYQDDETSGEAQEIYEDLKMLLDELPNAPKERVSKVKEYYQFLKSQESYDGDESC